MKNKSKKQTNKKNIRFGFNSQNLFPPNEFVKNSFKTFYEIILISAWCDVCVKWVIFLSLNQSFFLYKSKSPHIVMSTNTACKISMKTKAIQWFKYLNIAENSTANPEFLKQPDLCKWSTWSGWYGSVPFSLLLFLHFLLQKSLYTVTSRVISYGSTDFCYSYINFLLLIIKQNKNRVKNGKLCG